MKNRLAPSILSGDFTKLGEQIRAIEAAGVTDLHFDVMDGAFVPNISFGIPVLKSLRPFSDLWMDAHLMILDPIRYVEAFAKAGASNRVRPTNTALRPLKRFARPARRSVCRLIRRRMSKRSFRLSKQSI